MRTNLNVPFAEKDAAKALGARWDPALRVWYVRDAADLTPFARWTAGAVPANDAGATGSADSRPGVVTRAPRVAPLCDCRVLPWEPCPHTPAT